MKKPQRRCLTCKKLTSNGERCENCSPGRYGAAEERRMRTAVAWHIEKHGHWCPGDHKHAPHTSHDLTADHVKRWNQYGDTQSPLRIVCRQANSRRG